MALVEGEENIGLEEKRGSDVKHVQRASADRSGVQAREFGRLVPDFRDQRRRTIDARTALLSELTHYRIGIGPKPVFAEDEPFDGIHKLSLTQRSQQENGPSSGEPACS